MNNEPIRVAQVIGKLASAGVEAVVNNYYRIMDHRVFQFDYYIDDDSECTPPREMIEQGAHYYYIPSSRHPIARIRALKKLLKKNQPHIVHSHMNSLNAITLYAAWRAKIRVRISHNHSTSDKREGLRANIKDFLKITGNWFATEKMACGDKAARWLFGDKAVDNKGVFILPNAIDIEKYRFNLDVRRRMRKELHIEDKFVIGHVGRFMRQKNHEFLISVFEEVKKRKDDAVLLLIGDGELRQSIEDTVKHKGLTDSVVFLGNRTDVAQIYNTMDTFVLPSLYEGVPVVGIEAQANGLPCFFSDNISKEVRILENVSFHPLNVSAGIWGNAIVNEPIIAIEKKLQANNRLAESVFNLSVSGQQLVNRYIYLLNRGKRN